MDSLSRGSQPDMQYRIICSIRKEAGDMQMPAYDEFILEWMADIYTYMQWKWNLPLKDIVQGVGPAELYGKYYPLHEASIENGADKLRKFVVK